MNQNQNDIQREINTLKARNKRVELDKAWETSWTRRFIIAIMTYALIVIFMLVTKLEKPFISAIIPTVAYLISASALPFFKKWWIKKQ
ncbi:hypothetical protein KJ657_01045 [Patescibacteria group bacterium]|nr:hypothetical protein [Patescibacteria group bacterium]MBU1015653.1 hypothetical protein [Patescibacteria group bacterium]MBU1684772.1 hypothetical protein [Patescibacteria group bacterium]MBU1938206.1 hypothetical protein [Patescibacteria group bacterium]